MNSTLNSQTYVDKCNAPWFNSNWFDIDKIISMNRSDSGATVVCDDNIVDTAYMFYECYKLTTIDLSNFDTSKVKNMHEMFGRCSSLTTIKGIIDMKSCKYYMDMFDRCPRLTNVNIKNPPVDFESKSRLSKSQYTIVS